MLHTFETIEYFFKHYASLLIAADDLTSLSEQYSVPCQMLSQEQLVFVMTNEQLKAQLQQMTWTLNEMKVADVRVNHLQVKAINEHLVQASLQWQFFADKADHADHAFFDFSATYLLSIYAGKCSIVSVVSHEENQRGEY